MSTYNYRRLEVLLMRLTNTGDFTWTRRWFRDGMDIDAYLTKVGDLTYVVGRDGSFGVESEEGAIDVVFPISERFKELIQTAYFEAHISANPKLGRHLQRAAAALNAHPRKGFTVTSDSRLMG